MRSAILRSQKTKNVPEFFFLSWNDHAVKYGKSITCYGSACVVALWCHRHKVPPRQQLLASSLQMCCFINAPLHPRS